MLFIQQTVSGWLLVGILHNCYQSFSSRLSKAIFPYPFCFVPLITITKMTTKPSNILSHEISLPAILLSLKCFGVKQRDLEHDSKGSPLKLSNSVWSVSTGCYHMRECPTWGNVPLPSTESTGWMIDKPAPHTVQTPDWTNPLHGFFAKCWK